MNIELIFYIKAKIGKEDAEATYERDIKPIVEVKII